MVTKKHPTAGPLDQATLLWEQTSPGDKLTVGLRAPRASSMAVTVPTPTRGTWPLTGTLWTQSCSLSPGMLVGMDGILSPWSSPGGAGGRQGIHSSAQGHPPVPGCHQGTRASKQN